jgi:phosphatidylglycerol:prolipoprotein diacylglycerol transferase
MYPFLNLGLIKISSFGLMVALAWIVGVFIFWLIGRQEQADEEALIDLAFLASLGGLIGARVFYLLGHWQNFGVFDWFRIYSRPGLDWLGFLFGFFLVVYRFCLGKKWSFVKMGDLLVIPLALSESLGRIGCFLNGCVVGKVTRMPWGTLVSGYAGKRHPVAIYQSILVFIIFVALVKRRVKSRYSGYYLWRYGFWVGTAQTFLAVWQTNQVYWGRINLHRLIWFVGAIWFLGLLFRKEKEQWLQSTKIFWKSLSENWKGAKRSWPRRKKDW